MDDIPLHWPSVIQSGQRRVTLHLHGKHGVVFNRENVDSLGPAPFSRFGFLVVGKDILSHHHLIQVLPARAGQDLGLGIGAKEFVLESPDLQQRPLDRVEGPIQVGVRQSELNDVGALGRLVELGLEIPEDLVPAPLSRRSSPPPIGGTTLGGH
jgi:hypothetical protein